MINTYFDMGLKIFSKIGLTHYLVLAAMLFCIGLIGIIICKHLIRILISLELMFCAVNINFVALSKYCDIYMMQGHVFAIFIMAIEATEVALALAIIIACYRHTNSVDVNDYEELKG